MSQGSGTITEQRAVILNRQYLRWIEVPDEHVISDNGTGGWRLDVEKPTRIVVHLDSGVVRLDLSADDYVLANGNEVYIAIAAPASNGDGEGSPRR